MHILLLAILVFSSVNGSQPQTHLTESFARDRYEHAAIPYWLYQGLTLYLAHYFSDEEIATFKRTAHTLPTLQELENCSEQDDEHFAQINGFMASYLLVEFIDTAWNREKLLAIVQDYPNFENILRYLKKDVEKHWIYHTFFTAHAFQSGDQALKPLMKDLLLTFKKSLSRPYKNRTTPELEDILSSFTDYKTKIIESDNHVLTIIQNNSAIAGWALFSLQSTSKAMLEALCIHPEYRNHDISNKLVAALHQNFRHIKSITTVNKNMNLKTPYFCGTFDCEKKES